MLELRAVGIGTVKVIAPLGVASGSLAPRDELVCSGPLHGANDLLKAKGLACIMLRFR